MRLPRRDGWALGQLARYRCGSKGSATQVPGVLLQQLKMAPQPGGVKRTAELAVAASFAFFERLLGRVMIVEYSGQLGDGSRGHGLRACLR